MFNISHVDGSFLIFQRPSSSEIMKHAVACPKLIIIIIIGRVGLSALGTAATSGLLYKSQMIDKGDCGAIGGIKIGRGNQSTRRKPAPAPLCPPQNPT
jgi:hypothetical protein